MSAIEVVISGIGGTFPKSENLEMLKKNLFGRVDMIKRDKNRWTFGKCEVTSGTGKIANTSKFDADFFGIDSKQCKSLDPMIRILLEKAFEAVMDSGNNPTVFKGTNVGVYVACSIGESEILGVCRPDLQSPDSLLGHNRSMMANHISYYMDLKGPSLTLDSLWIGGLQALHLASQHISQGHIDAAIVGVANVHFLPNVSAEYDGLKLTCIDGKCRSFDAEASGYARSEAVTCFFLQNMLVAKRNYGTIIEVNTKCIGSRDCSFVDSNEKYITDSLVEFYKACEINPSDVVFVEADGCAVKKIENVELMSLSNVFCVERKFPLLIGSVKSNLGHTETSAALVSVTKALIAMDTGVIPPNLHCNSPNTDVPSLSNGEMKVVSELEALPGDLVAVNVTCFNGGFGHALFRRNTRAKKEECEGGNTPQDGLPRLVLTSARHEKGMNKVNDLIKTLPLDTEFIALVNNIHKYNTIGHRYRAYSVLSVGDEILQESQECVDTKREVWFIFTGLNSQWNGMGVGLMKVPVFAAAIEKCQKILSPLGVNLKDVLTNLEHTLFENILNCFLGVVAIQIGLVDMLSSLGIVPDGIVGYSIGELGCAYADGCFTVEETILSAYALGKACLDTLLIDGTIGAVGMNYNTTNGTLPESIEFLNLLNSQESCILSGPVEDVNKNIQRLTEERIFTCKINVGNIAYHSQYFVPAVPKCLNLLKEVITDPKLRSSKWISSCFPEADWQTSLAMYSSPEYHSYNLISPVLFQETCKCIPENAIAIEISPHELLQDVLQLSRSTIHIPLMNRSADCSLRFILAAIGKLYLNNLQPDVNAIYPPIDYPVSRGTFGIAQLITWDHTKEWTVYNQSKTYSASGVKAVDLTKYLDENQHIQGYKFNNNIIIPTAELLILVWEMFSEDGVALGLLPVTFEEVMIFDHIITSNSGDDHLGIMIQRSTGNFEVFIQDNSSDSVRPIVKGKISVLVKIEGEVLSSGFDAEGAQIVSEDSTVVSEEEFYNCFESKGYQLSSYFKHLKEIKVIDNECKGQIIWNNHWLPFIDALLKVNEYFSMVETRELLGTSFIQKLIVDTTKFSSENSGNIFFTKDSSTNTLQCNGVEVYGAQMSRDNVPTDPQVQLNVTRLKLTPLLDACHQLDQFFITVLHLVSETNLLSWKNKITQLVICEVIDDTLTKYLVPQFEKVIDSLNHIKVQSKVVTFEGLKDLILQNPTTPHLILIHSKHLNTCAEQFHSNDPIYFLTHVSEKLFQPDNTMVPVLHHKCNDKYVILFKKSIRGNKLNVVETIEGPNWLWSLKHEVIQIPNCERIVVAFKTMREIEVIKMCKLLAKEDYAHRLCCFFLLDKNAPKFSINSSHYTGVLSQGLMVNILSEGNWSTFQRVQITNIQENTKEERSLPIISFEELDLHYLGINSKDKNFGEIANDFEIGSMEYSGTSNIGQIMGLATYEQLTLKIIPDDTLNWVIPVGWTLEDAATVPLAYATAYLALHFNARLMKDETILVNSGQSCIGEAVIAVALQLCGDVFTTVTNEEQSIALVKRFPNLKHKQILNCKRNNMDINVLMATKGKGVKVIVNSLSGTTLQTCLKCLAENGRFIQLGLAKADMENRQQEMLPSLHSIVMLSLTTDNVFNITREKKEQLHTMVQEGITKGVVKPLPRKVFPEYQSNLALHLLKKKSRQEKIILALKKNQQSNGDKKQIHFKCDPHKSYLIVGTRHGLWLNLTEWLVDQGARNIVVAFNHQHTINSLNARRMDSLVTRYDTTIIMSSAKKADSEIAVYDLVREATRLGPLDAIFNLYLKETSCKVKHIDLASRMLAPELSYFVCILGGDAYVCDERRQAGLPALTIQCDAPLNKPKGVLKCLAQLLENQDMSSGSQLVLVNDSAESIKINDEDNCVDDDPLKQHLPSSQELYDLGAMLLPRPQITEVTSLSPRMKYSKNGVKSVYIFPGVNHTRMEPLVRKLHYPVFTIQLPTVWKSVSDTASHVVDELLRAHNPGVYTLVSETWTGALTIEVGRQLEAQGHSVSLILLNAAPSITQRWAKMISCHDTSEFDVKLLTHFMNLSAYAKKELSKASTWEDRLEQALKLQDEVKKINYSKSLTYIHSMLIALLNFKPSDNLFQGNVTLVRQNTASYVDTCHLQMYCQNINKVWLITDASTHSQLIASDKTAAIVNGNVNYFV